MHVYAEDNGGWEGVSAQGTPALTSGDRTRQRSQGMRMCNEDGVATDETDDSI